MNNIITDTMKTHKAVIEELYSLDPETQAHQLRTANFFLKHPELIGISYASADLIIAEKDVRVANAAIKTIIVEILRRSDVNAPNYRLTHRKVTENTVRKILHAERLKANPDTKTAKPRNADITLKCPKCNEEVSFERIMRDKIVAFRATVETDDAIEYLSNQCGVSRSFLVEKLLKIEKRFGSEFQ